MPLQERRPGNLKERGPKRGRSETAPAVTPASIEPVVTSPLTDADRERAREVRARLEQIRREAKTEGALQAQPAETVVEGKGFGASLAEPIKALKEMGNETFAGRAIKWTLKIGGWAGGFLMGGVAMLLDYINKTFWGGSASKASK
jgi:hypothetical protein